MNLLILGGTKFVGRHITSTALMRGHHVTLFNRGQTNTNLFTEAERIHGNREGGLDALRGRTWDTVLDINGYLPRIVQDSAQRLANAADHYLFISTLSVYADFWRHGQTEESPLAQLQDPTAEVVDGDTYGGLKVLSERAVRQAFPNRALILRLGYVVGPHDHTDRWTSWLRRITRGGEMLAPGKPDAPVQFIDVRDAAAFAIDMVERRAAGIYNTHGFNSRTSWGECFAQTQRLAGTDTQLTWVDEEFLKAHKLEPGELPMYAFSEDAGIFTFDNHKATSAGLRFRPLAETFRDTLLWDASEGTHTLGIKPAREAELLREWRERR
jgi:2'-hydroxyisoflavone reductase